MAQSAPMTGELNFIVSYIWNGCRTPQQLLVQTALPVAGEIALVFLDTDWMDIVTRFYRPKGLRSNRHGRKKRAGKKFGGVPQIIDLVAEDVVSLNEPFFGTPTAATKFLWQLEGFIEGVSWTVAVVEMSEGLIMKTMLGVLKLKATKCQIPGRVFATGQDLDPFNNGQLYWLPVPTTEYVEYPCTNIAATPTIEDTNYYQILADVVAHNNGDEDGDFELEFWISAAEGGGIYQQPYQSLGPGGTQGSPFSAIVKGPAFFQWYQRSHGPIMYPSVSISAIPSAFTT